MKEIIAVNPSALKDVQMIVVCAMNPMCAHVRQDILVIPAKIVCPCPDVDMVAVITHLSATVLMDGGASIAIQVGIVYKLHDVVRKQIHITPVIKITTGLTGKFISTSTCMLVTSYVDFI